MREHEEPIRVPHDIVKPHEKHERRFLQVGENANFVHQYYALEDAPEDILGHPVPANTQELSDLTARMFTELRGYGISVALANVVPMSEREDKPAIFITAHDIEPTSTLGRAEFRKVMEAQFDVWSKLLDYFEHKARTGEPYLWDVHSVDQYIWGKAGSDAESHLYMVDLHPRISAMPGHMVNVLGTIVREMKKIGPRVASRTGLDFGSLEKRAARLAEKLRAKSR